MHFIAKWERTNYIFNYSEQYSLQIIPEYPQSLASLTQEKIKKVWLYLAPLKFK